MTFDDRPFFWRTQCDFVLSFVVWAICNYYDLGVNGKNGFVCARASVAVTRPEKLRTVQRITDNCAASRIARFIDVDADGDDHDDDDEKYVEQAKVHMLCALCGALSLWLAVCMGVFVRCCAPHSRPFNIATPVASRTQTPSSVTNSN